ncbi:MAG: phospho-sugar mutase [Planctomycetia bacterium]|nr:phospho-sugar mutase [Planctomycetia bacterium]
MASTVEEGAVRAALASLDQALQQGQLTADAVKNIRVWLTEPCYAEYTPQVVEHIQSGKWKALDDVFWTIIPFGTGGRRGKMYPIGSNAINDRTIGESAQGLADYVKQSQTGPLSCAIAYDTRHRSREFAELCAEILVAAGFQIYFLDGYRSTPELSVAVRVKHCSCGIMVTASHNPPSDNAVKAYWSTGGQLLPPHDKGVIDAVGQVRDIERVPFAEALKSGRVVYCQQEIDQAYWGGVQAQGTPGPRDLKVIFSPLHGVGASSVLPVLSAGGFSDVELFALHAEPSGDFPNVPGHVSNPENPRVFDAIIERAQATGADLVMATDPDADRLGAATPVTRGGGWQTFTGNQIGVLLVDYLLENRKRGGGLTPQHYIVKTLVTSEMIRRIADSYGVRTVGDLQVGFKWIGGVIDEQGPERFLFGAEESHGYLTGTYARDKDAAVGALLLAELAAKVKAAGQTLHEKLDSLFWQHGCHQEGAFNLTMPGAAGMDDMRRLMSRLREAPPQRIGGLKLRSARDYQSLRIIAPDGSTKPFEGPQGDMVICDLAAEGNFVAIRPSGTEPKVKFYLFTYEPAEQLANLDDTKAELQTRLAAFEKDLRAFAAGAT